MTDMRVKVYQMLRTLGAFGMGSFSGALVFTHGSTFAIIGFVASAVCYVLGKARSP